MTDPIPMLVDFADIEAWAVAAIEEKLANAGSPHLKVQGGQLQAHEDGYLVLLVERAPVAPPKPKIMSLADFLNARILPSGVPEVPRLPPLPRAAPVPRLEAPAPAHQMSAELRSQLGGEADRIQQLLHEAVRESAPFGAEAEPPPLLVAHQDPNKPILYNGAPQVSESARQAFAQLQEAGLVDAHLTPELLASTTRDDVLDGVGDRLTNGYVKGSTPPAGHPNDPHKHSRWRVPAMDIRASVAGALRKAD